MLCQPLEPEFAYILRDSANFADKVLPMYMESAREYAQLATGALAFSIGFREKVLGNSQAKRPHVVLVLSWFSFLVTIGCAAWYHHVATKLAAQHLSGVATGCDPYDLPVHFPLTVGWLWPGNAYGGMVASFYCGSILFVLAAALQIWTPSVPLARRTRLVRAPHRVLRRFGQSNALHVRNK